MISEIVQLFSITNFQPQFFFIQKLELPLKTNENWTTEMQDQSAWKDLHPSVNKLQQISYALEEKKQTKTRRQKLPLLSQSETCKKHKKSQKQIKCNGAKNQALQNPYRSDQYFRFHILFSLVGKKRQKMGRGCFSSILQKVF